MAGERDIPDGERVVAGRRLRAGTIGGDDQRRVVDQTNLADRSPLLNRQRTRDPGNDVLIIGIVKVHPAKVAGGLLRAKGKNKSQRSGSNNEATGEANPHGFRYSRAGREEARSGRAEQGH